MQLILECRGYTMDDMRHMPTIDLWLSWWIGRYQSLMRPCSTDHDAARQ